MHTRAPIKMQQYVQFVNEYEQIISIVHDYKNNFELFFKQATVLKFSVNAKTLDVSHIYCNSLLIDAALNKKLEHFFLCKINTALVDLMQQSSNSNRLYSLLVGYSLTKQPASDLLWLGAPLSVQNTYLSDTCVNGMLQAQYFQNMKAYLICKQDAYTVLQVSAGFWDGFYSHIETLLQTHPQNNLLHQQLKAAKNINTLMKTLSNFNMHKSHNHAALGIKFNETSIEATQFAPSYLKNWLIANI